MNERRCEHTATLLLDGRVLVVGGHDSSAFDASAEISSIRVQALGSPPTE